MTAIYEPRGAAAEYSGLAANLYRGCGHGCRYCYAPACLRMSAAEFHEHPSPRAGILQELARDAASLAALGAPHGGERRPVLLCFTCDPYQPLERTEQLTRRALEILLGAGLAVRVLTKNGPLAIERDLDLLTSGGIEFGQTLLWTDDTCRREWEPGAASVQDRIAAQRAAKAAGLATWLSLEPVIDPDQALGVIDAMAPHTDLIKVGKINHDARHERAVDWRAFLLAALERLTAARCRWYIKDALWLWADRKLAGRYSRRSTGRSRG